MTIVIGGGPAGAAAAILLARGRAPVTLFEREAAAHDKVCGEFISWEAAHYLQALGLDLPGLGAVPIGQILLAVGEKSVVTPLPFPAWSLSRRIVDEALLAQAAQAGVDIRRGVTVTGLHLNHTSWQVTAGQQQFSAPHLFLATGKHEMRGWKRDSAGADDFIGFKMHFRLSSDAAEKLRGGVEVMLFDGGYAGLQPIEEGKANLCFVVRKAVYQDCGKDWTRLLARMSERAPHLVSRLAGATALWPRPLTIYGIPYGHLHRDRGEGPGLFRLGDQMAVIPSFAGDGISMALHSAFLAARHRAAGAAVYHAAAFEDFKRPVRRARGLSAMAARSGGRGSMMWLAQLAPGLLQKAACRIRLDSESVKNATRL